MIDVIKINVPTFIRLMELAREDIKNDMDIHDVAEIVTKISQERLVTMDDYDSIVGFMKHQGNDNDLGDIKRLSGLD